MAAFQKFNSFSEALAEKVHNLESDVIKVMMTNTAPIATNSVKANLTEIAAGNGYVAGGQVVTIGTSSQTAGTYTAVIDGNNTFTAAGGSIGPARYFVVYNDTATNDELIGFYDYGSEFTLADGESVNFNGNGVSLIQINSPA